MFDLLVFAAVGAHPRAVGDLLAFVEELECLQSEALEDPVLRVPEHEVLGEHPLGDLVSLRQIEQSVEGELAALQRAKELAPVDLALEGHQDYLRLVHQPEGVVDDRRAVHSAIDHGSYSEPADLVFDDL